MESVQSSWDAVRIDRIAAGDPSVEALIRRLVEVSADGLPGMRPGEGLPFSFTVRRGADGAPRQEGESLRYTAIVLLGARWLDTERQRSVLGGETADELCGTLLAGVNEIENLGDIALVTWAASELEHPDAARGLDHLLAVADAQPSPFTVELAWVLSALCALQPLRDVSDHAARIAKRLEAAFPERAGVFRHQVAGGGGFLRGHVGCFADQVYPIQALSRFHRRFGSERSLKIADRCGAQICEVQGPEGQWWWHYDARTGRVVEGYPVYSVHQDSMAPMALLDLYDAGGTDHAEAIRLGLRWMDVAAEVGHSLIDEENQVIWRKVGRTDPAKIVRAGHAAVSALHPSLRLGVLDAMFPPTRIDWESRPYHLGWVLHAWLGIL